jgi:hypothetical protein
MLLMNFRSIFSQYTTIVLLSFPPFRQLLNSLSVSDSDVIKATKRLRPSKSVGVDDILGFIIKGWTDIFVPILKHVFNLSLSQQHFLTLWKHAAIIPVLRKDKSTSVSNYRPISLLSNKGMVPSDMSKPALIFFSLQEYTQQNPPSKF